MLSLTNLLTVIVVYSQIAGVQAYMKVNFFYEVFTVDISQISP